MKKILVFLIVVTLVGCAIPGSYMGVSDMKTPVNVNGRLLNPTVIPIDADLFQKNNYQFLDISFAKPNLYRVGPYDILSIVVWNHPELGVAGVQSIQGVQGSALPGSSQESNIAVDANGEIFYPLVGKIRIAGLTVDQVRDELASKLGKYIRDPQIGVRMVEFNSEKVYVIGEVGVPGNRPLTDKPLSLLEAINNSGSISSTAADAKHIYVLRDTLPKVTIYWLDARNPQNLLLASRFKLANNDIVYVAPAGVVSLNRVISQVMPLVQTVWYTRSLVRDYSHG